MLLHNKRTTALWFVTIMLLLGAYDFSLAAVNEPQDAYLEVKFRSEPTPGVHAYEIERAFSRRKKGHSPCLSE